MCRFRGKILIHFTCPMKVNERGYWKRSALTPTLVEKKAWAFLQLTVMQT